MPRIQSDKAVISSEWSVAYETIHCGCVRTSSSYRAGLGARKFQRTTESGGCAGNQRGERRKRIHAAAGAARGAVQKWRWIFRAFGARARESGCARGFYERAIE